MKTNYPILSRPNLISCVLFLLFTASCNKLVEVSPPSTFVNSGNVFSTDNTAISVLTGIYTPISDAGFGGGTKFTSIYFIGGLSADEFNLYGATSSHTDVAYYTNSLSNSNTADADFWSGTYPYIYYANAAIAGLTTATGLTPAVRQQLLGEAKFMRAVFYFYLVNLYGDVPMPLSTNYAANASLSRTPKQQVYSQIIQDLKDAQGLLNQNYVDGTVIKTTTERTRPNKWAATALLARVYLYTGDFSDAETQATSVISNTSLYTLTPLNAAFLMNSLEAIWQLQPVHGTLSNTFEGQFFILPASGPNDANPVSLSSSLLNSFEPNDQRRFGINWIDSVTADGTTYYYPYKYKVNDPSAAVSEYEMVLRLGEQYLIRAEARAQNGDSTGTLLDLNAIRNRAGLPNYTGATDKASLLNAVQHERQVELFSEGQRWLDLKRTGIVDSVMSVATPQKGGTWKTDWQWYPIPVYDLQKDINLVQNAGY